MHLQDAAIQKMVAATDTSSWRIAGKGGVEISSVEDLICPLAIEPSTKEDANTKTGLLRIELGTQAAIDNVKSQ